MSGATRPARKRYCAARLELQEWRWLVEEADRLGTSVSHVIRLAVRAYQRGRMEGPAPCPDQVPLALGGESVPPPGDPEGAGLAPHQFLRFFGGEATDAPAEAGAGDRRDQRMGPPGSEA